MPSGSPPVSQPFGSWRSVITPELLVERAVGLSGVEVDGDRVLWIEARPSEAGRVAIVGDGTDLIDPPFSARTLAHEYGGRCVVAHDGVVVFSNQVDQRLWKREQDGTVMALTPEPSAPRSVRFADPIVSADGAWVIAVRETHHDFGSVVNDIVAVPLAGGAPEPLVAGHDFFSAPRLSPDGSRLAWMLWDQPAMPWDSSEVWVATWADGTVSEASRVAGGDGVSVSQPRWSPDGRLHYLSDHTGWWNLYDEEGTALAPLDAEFGGPDWAFGQSTYTFLPDGRLVAVWQEGAGERLGIVEGGSLRPIPLEFTSFESVYAAGSASLFSASSASASSAPASGPASGSQSGSGSDSRSGSSIVAIASSPTSPAAVVRIDVDTAEVEILRMSRSVPVAAAEISVAQPIEYPTEGGLLAHALFYPPLNSAFAAPAGELPPLIVMSHGGPTAQASSSFDLRTQYWTNRGFAVVDVDYGGSTGYGRAYRDRLQGQWGIVDLDDCVNAARWLAEQGRVDGARMVIRGGSAGGYTTLCALTFRDVFAAGASLYGVADAELLAKDTHKFEARYLDGLIGPYPEAAEEYRRRSPIHYADQIACPVIVFQGLDDKVVPPEQSEAIVDALRASGVPVAYLAFEDEQHGFRKAETIIAVARAELEFYGRVLGFRPAGDPVQLQIENESALR